MEYPACDGEENSVEERIVSENAWQRWQALYAIRRRETFKQILEARGKQMRFVKKTTVISNTRRCYIDLTHRDSDPLTWIVRRRRKFLWFKKIVSTDWFNSEHQAMTFAHDLKQKCDGPDNLRIAKNVIHHDY